MARKTLTGKVVSDKMSKTRVVSIDRVFAHPAYGNVMRRQTTIHAHDEKNISRAGDYVAMSETRPFSKTKCWEITAVTKSESSASAASGKSKNGTKQ